MQTPECDDRVRYTQVLAQSVAQHTRDWRVTIVAELSGECNFLFAAL